MENEEMKPMFDASGLQANAKIKVIGVGGGGSNAVNGMIHDKEDMVEYWVFNTDSQALSASPCENKLVLGKNVTRGLGAGGLPEMGKKAAEDSYNDIELVVKGSDMVFLAAGEGGGTGTGAAPIVAKAAKEAGCLVLAIVTRPFTFEGKQRKLNALEGIKELEKYVDALIVVSNDKMMFNNGKMSIGKAFEASDQVLASSVKTVTDLILVHGIINLDFADVKATLSGKGLALIGIGYGEGKNKALDAAESAINSPLLESSIRGSKSMIINFTVGDDTTLDDVNYAVAFITDAAGGDKNNEVNIIFGVQQDSSYHDKMKVAIIATDFDKAVDFLSSDKPYVKKAEPSLSPLPTQGNAPEDLKAKENDAVKKIEKQENESSEPSYLRQFFERAEKKEESSASVEETPVETKEETKADNTPVNMAPQQEEEEEDDAVVIEHQKDNNND
ncbi:MAG: cell division protein FtsZ [Eubacteriales bacterium]|nr:cell division protein FtsZ [Eubacteriales bacterium]